MLEVLEAAKWAMSQKHSDSFSLTDSGYEGEAQLMYSGLLYISQSGVENVGCDVSVLICLTLQTNKIISTGI